MSETEKITRLLSLPDKGRMKAIGELTRLWRDILAERQVGPLHWGKLMVDHINKSYGRSKTHSKKRSTDRGNLNRQLASNNMSWKMFRRAIRFLNPRRAWIEFHMEWDEGPNTMISLDIHRRPGESFVPVKPSGEKFDFGEELQDVDPGASKRNSHSGG